MNNWETHNVKFLPAEGLQPNETSIRMLDEDLSEEEQVANSAKRAEMLGEPPSAEHAVKVEKLTTEVKTDPGYKFLMMVAAFSSRRLAKLVSVPESKTNETVCDTVCVTQNQEHWMYSPEVSGVVHLSAPVYGHIKEAEGIVHNGFSNASLKTLIENPEVSRYFARLVAVRMSITSCLASTGYRLDQTFARLHQEQTMVLSALRKASSNIQVHDWSRPMGSRSRLGLEY
tara:strand:- start:17039 stop:17725 length:687 start_codon:yes stop_codon:yes gene_type:complete